MNSGKKATDITGSTVSEEICRKDSTVYIYDQPTVDTSTLDSNIKADYEKIMQMLPAIKASIKTTTVTMGDLGAFSTKDLHGEAVDNSIFAEHKLTMINIWATFCRPCIKEMPDLQKMSEAMPEGTQLISIVGDVDDEEHLKLAQQIAKDKGVSFTSIVPDESLRQYLDNNIVAYPTTLFVDSTGKIVGEAIIGERDISVYKKVLNDRLAQNN
jgi:thiol-disulfide isomerase/thioredoxin